jgi:adenylate cyclase
MATARAPRLRRALRRDSPALAWRCVMPPVPPPPTTMPIVQPAVAPRLSIVVLPFANLGSDPDQQYFADGITEDLTTDLSRLADMFVISRNTAFTYRTKPIATRQIGRELGVRYVLEGSVRRSGSQLRVNAQLIDAATDAHLWVERFDSDTGNLFTLQNEITSRIAVALNIELTSREAARPTEHPDALDYILRGRAAYWKPNSLEKWVETVSLFERALTLDPQSVQARSWLAAALAFRVANGYAYSATLEIQRAEELLGKALAASPRNWFAHYAKGSLRRVVQHRCEEAIAEYEIALALNPKVHHWRASGGGSPHVVPSPGRYPGLFAERYASDWTLLHGSVVRRRGSDGVSGPRF